MAGNSGEKNDPMFQETATKASAAPIQNAMPQDVGKSVIAFCDGECWHQHWIDQTLVLRPLAPQNHCETDRSECHCRNQAGPPEEGNDPHVPGDRHSFG